MKQPLKENGGLPASILWTLAIVAGISVANIYYVQPLLNMIRHELGISEFRTNLIAMVTQIGYAAGLLFITPLGDLYQRKKIILAIFLVLIFSLLTIALAHNIHVILVASFLTGACSMIPQIFIPMAAQFSRPEHKGRNVGIVLSGLLTGILASRVVSGFVGELFGWREMGMEESGQPTVHEFMHADEPCAAVVKSGYGFDALAKDLHIGGQGIDVLIEPAETFTIPLASMSKVTSICGTPRGAGAIPSRWKVPKDLLSRANSRSPCR